MSEVVTGEAVVLSVRVAQAPSRAAALLVDLLVQGVTLIAAVLTLTAASFAIDSALATALSILLVVLVVVGYPVVFETATRGRSLGKLAMGLRVVSDDGGPERFRQALFRGLAAVLEIWLLAGAPALICSLVSSQGKRLGDVFAGTFVISDRGPRQPPPPPMPPQLAGWAATLQLSQLSDDLAGTARNYLLRWESLAPQVRMEMGERVAGQVAACVAPPPPPGTPAPAYLAAVLAERRSRTITRLQRRPGIGIGPGQEPPLARPTPTRPAGDGGLVPPS